MAKIFTIYGDMGSAKDLVPVINMLVENEVHQVTNIIFGEGAKAHHVLEKAGLSYETRLPVAKDRPDAIVVGVCATATEGQIAWTRFGRRHNVPTIWIEDMWGTGSHENTCIVDPDAMCVIDSTAAEIAVRVRPELKIFVTGKPSFEDFGKKLPTKEKVRTRIRMEIAARIGLQKFDGNIVTYASGGRFYERDEIHLKYLTLAQMGATTGKKTLFIPRLHPKLPFERRWEFYLRSQKVRVPIVTAYDLELDELVMASDVVCTDWGSREGLVAALSGVPCIICLFPESFRERETRLARGYKDGIPPLIAGGSAFSAKDELLFNDLLENILSDLPSYREIVESNGQAFRHILHPGAKRRIVEVIKSYLR